MELHCATLLNPVLSRSGYVNQRYRSRQDRILGRAEVTLPRYIAENICIWVYVTPSTFVCSILFGIYAYNANTELPTNAWWLIWIINGVLHLPGAAFFLGSLYRVFITDYSSHDRWVIRCLLDIADVMDTINILGWIMSVFAALFALNSVMF